MVPYEKHWASLVATNGEKNCFALDWFPEGYITKIVLKQLGGTLSNFRIKLLNSERPCVGGSGSSGSPTDPPDPDGVYEVSTELYDVLQEQTPAETAAGDVMAKVWDAGIPFKIMDLDEHKQPKRKLYLELSIPTGSGDSTWDLALGGCYVERV